MDMFKKLDKSVKSKTSDTKSRSSDTKSGPVGINHTVYGNPLLDRDISHRSIYDSYLQTDEPLTEVERRNPNRQPSTLKPSVTPPIQKNNTEYKDQRKPRNSIHSLETDIDTQSLKIDVDFVPSRDDTTGNTRSAKQYRPPKGPPRPRSTTPIQNVAPVLRNTIEGQAASEQKLERRWYTTDLPHVVQVEDELKTVQMAFARYREQEEVRVKSLEESLRSQKAAAATDTQKLQTEVKRLEEKVKTIETALALQRKQEQLRVKTLEESLRSQKAGPSTDIQKLQAELNRLGVEKENYRKRVTAMNSYYKIHEAYFGELEKIGELKRREQGEKQKEEEIELMRSIQLEERKVFDYERKRLEDHQKVLKDQQKGLAEERKLMNEHFKAEQMRLEDKRERLKQDQTQMEQRFEVERREISQKKEELDRVRNASERPSSDVVNVPTIPIPSTKSPSIHAKDIQRSGPDIEQDDDVIHVDSPGRTPLNTANDLSPKKPIVPRSDGIYDNDARPSESKATAVRRGYPNVMLKGFRLHWTCICGQKGFDHYIEYRPGAIQDLVESLRKSHVKISSEPFDPLNPQSEFLKIGLLRLRNHLRNFIQDLPDQVSRVFTITSVQSASNSSESLSENSFPDKTQRSQGIQPSQEGALGTAVIKSSSRRTNSRPTQNVAPLTQQPQVIQMPPANYMLLCMKMEQWFNVRHDMSLKVIGQDKELFEAFRTYYNEKISWIHRTLSFQTVQRMKLVRFALRSNSEVDLIEPGVPPETEKHYEFLPRPPGQEPPIGSDFLMHRFHKPRACGTDDFCLNQIPKRKASPPIYGDLPDMYTGWGVHFEEGWSAARMSFCLVVGCVSSLMFGVVWSAIGTGIQDAFQIAGYVLAFEALLVTSFQTAVAFGTL